MANLPPQLQNAAQKLQEHLPVVQSALRQTGEAVGPLWQQLRKAAVEVSKKLAQAGPNTTLGNTFRHLCFVGLNKSEMLMGGEQQSAFSDNWHDLVNDNLKRHMALMFFAPRGLDGNPVNPYLFLTGEGKPEDPESVDPNALALAYQTLGGMALIDLCRLTPSPPNTVNILLVADTLFHWDVKDNYVLPTTATGWVRDVEQVLRSYPRTTRANLYTQWDTEVLPPSERISVHKLREFPLDPATWLNQPTVQEKYGNHMLVVGVALAVLTYAGLWMKEKTLGELTDRLHVVEQQIPRGGQFSDLERAIAEQEKMWQRRDLFGLVVKDAARAIQQADMQIADFEVRVSEPQNPPTSYLITITGKPGVYQGWLQEEPIARAVLLNSAVMDAMRKPPTPNAFKLEGLVIASSLAKQYKQVAPKPMLTGKSVSVTAPEEEGGQ